MIDVRMLLGEKQAEDLRLEAKRAVGGIPESLWETYSAFANTAGGKILLGVEELEDKSLRPRGVPDADEMVQELKAMLDDPARVSRNILLPGQLYVQSVNDADIIVIEVPRATSADRPIYINGDPYTGSYVRMGDADIRCESWQIEQMLSGRGGKGGPMPQYASIAELPRGKLLELLGNYAKNWLAHDGFWFQSIERKLGMEEANEHNIRAWKGLTQAEAKRIKEFLKLPERAGVDGLRRALRFRMYAPLNRDEIVIDGDTLTYRVLGCRVQDARARKGMEFHPCKPVGETEYGYFAKVIDDRFTTECVSCFPEVTDDTCRCAWRFTLARTEEK